MKGGVQRSGFRRDDKSKLTIIFFFFFLSFRDFVFEILSCIVYRAFGDCMVLFSLLSNNTTVTCWSHVGHVTVSNLNM